jgi:RNA polymerase sigma factor (sigma-70 family)
MRTGDWGGAVRRACAALLRPSAGGPEDGDLLGRFVRSRDGVAFAELVRRHGPMVLGVCRRVLGDRHDAEDAFQATFLILARKAGSVRPAGRVGPWLHGVARRTALAARRAAARRRLREAEAVAVRAATSREGTAELREVLDLELARLPERYRSAVVLCELEGRTRWEAAALLGWAEGTVASRLARARTLLAARLTRRGVALPAAGLAALAPAAVPGQLVASAVGAALVFGMSPAAGVVMPPAAGLAEAVMKAMLLAKLKIGAALATAAAVAGLGVGLLPASGAGVPTTVGQAAAAAVTAQVDDPAAPRPEVARKLKAEIDQLTVEVEQRRKDLKLAEYRLAMAMDRLKELMGSGADLAPDSKKPLPRASKPGSVDPLSGPIDKQGLFGQKGDLPRKMTQQGLDDPTAGRGDVRERLDHVERVLDKLLKEVESLRQELRSSPPRPKGPGI